MLIIIFILGLIIGSFLNAAIHRLNSGQSIWTDRSRCVHCHHPLAAVDLIPVFSFLLLGGKCRYCGKSISWQYPLVELGTAIVFILLFLDHGSRITDHGFWFQIIFACIFIIIGIFDFKHYLILDKVVYPALGLSLVWSAVNGQEAIVGSLLGAVIVSGFFALQYFLSHGRWIGMGDVKLGLLLGSVFGIYHGIAVLMLAYVLGALAGVALIALGRKNLSSKLPFGTFLATSAIIILLYGQQIVSWYLELIGYQ